MNHKTIFLVLALQPLSYIGAQEVYLRKIADIEKNSTDKFLFAISQPGNNSKYLGEVEVIGFTDNDQKIFTQIYNKAKEIGANTYTLKRFENIDGTLQDFDPSHYKLSMYCTPASEIKENTQKVFVISSPQKPMSIRLNSDKVDLPPRTFKAVDLLPGNQLTISTRKFLGSSIKYLNDNSQYPAYFQVEGFSIKENSYGEAGLRLKSGDIMKLDTSYGKFLTTIYQEKN